MRSYSVLVLATATALGCASLPAAAQVTCASKPVSAKGRVALLEGAARSKARAAWIHKVRHSRKLGPSYAAWLRAKGAKYSCSRQGRHHICQATATPCKI